MKPAVVLFGMDGATYTILDDLVEHGVMPFLGEFMAAGARGRALSTVPHLTPPAWTTIVTGRSPGTHGILNFLLPESPDSPYVRIISHRQITSETVWSIASRHGVRVGCFNFIAHHPPPRINGSVIPGWVPWRWVKKYSHPADLIDRLRQRIPGFDVKELAMNFSEEEKAIAGTTRKDYGPWIDLHIRRERQWFDILKDHLRSEPSGLTGIVFDGVDKLQHLLWQYLDPALEPSDPDDAFLRTRAHCRDYFRQLDHCLEETVKLAGPDAHVVVVSDHGFTGTSEILYINTWLQQEGYLSWNGSEPVRPDESQELGDAHPTHLTAFDFGKTVAFASSASSNGIHINVAGVRGDEGVAPKDYEQRREELIRALLTRCNDPETGEPLITHVWKREDIFGGPHMMSAPDLTVELRDKGFFSIYRTEKHLKRRPNVMGCHHPRGVFIAHGPGVAAGSTLKPLRLLDIAPTLLYLLGIAIPKDLEGDVVSEALTAKYLDRRPVRYGAPSGAPDNPPGVAEDEQYDEEGLEQVTMRLRALGYLD